MSHKATNWAVEQRGIKPIAKVLLWHLADRHHPDNGCFPSQAALAADCEISRASVNRHLDELEAAGLIRREPRIDPETKKQLPTRYVLAFEPDFGTPDVVSRVSNSDTAPCLKNERSRVSKSVDPVSHSSETLTSNRTGKGTGNALRATSERVSFDDAWDVFPHRPMPNRTAGQKAWDALSDDETHRCFTAIKRYARWHIEDSEARGVDPKAQLEFRPGMGKWIGSGAWVEALTVPLKSDPVPPAANGLMVLPPDHPDFKAVERLRGRPVYVGDSGRATFRVEEIEQARAVA